MKIKFGLAADAAVVVALLTLNKVYFAYGYVRSAILLLLMEAYNQIRRKIFFC